MIISATEKLDTLNTEKYIIRHLAMPHHRKETIENVENRMTNFQLTQSCSITVTSAFIEGHTWSRHHYIIVVIHKDLSGTPNRHLDLEPHPPPPTRTSLEPPIKDTRTSLEPPMEPPIKDTDLSGTPNKEHFDKPLYRSTETSFMSCTLINRPRNKKLHGKKCPWVEVCSK